LSCPCEIDETHAARRLHLSIAPLADIARELDVGEQKENVMLWTIAMVLAVLWLLGMVSAYTMGGFVHILLILAVAVILINVIQGRRLA
jgi:fatty acid desaturase